MTQYTPNPAATEDRVGALLARRLDEGLQDIGPDIAERLRFSRERALARARQAQLQAVAAQAPSWVGGVQLGLAAATSGSRTWPNTGLGSSHGQAPGSSWWVKLVSALPLVILGLGLLVIQDTLIERQIQAAAEVDAALLADDLPPQAYSDPGFAEFLRREAR